MQRILPEQLQRVQHLLVGEWIDSEVLTEALAEGLLGPFFRELERRGMVIISSQDKVRIPFKYEKFIETPKANAFEQRRRIINEIKEYGRPVNYVFACGMAATAFVSELHGTIPGASFIDIGHMFDPFIGDMSRSYLYSADPVKLQRNIE